MASVSPLRVIADGLIHQAEALPRQSRAAALLRDAAASLLDADAELEPEVGASILPFRQGLTG